MNNVLNDTLTLAPSEVPGGPCNHKQRNSFFMKREDKKMLCDKNTITETAADVTSAMFHHMTIIILPQNSQVYFKFIHICYSCGNNLLFYVL